MSGAANDVEAARLAWKPDRVAVLFVGESPPAQGTFFYHGDSNLYRYTKQAFESALGQRWHTTGAFLTFFRDHGCYLVDLYRDASSVQTRAGQRDVDRLACEIAQAQPGAVIVVKKSIVNDVWLAVRQSGASPAVFTSLPFPTYSWQGAYVKGLEGLLRKLPQFDDHGH